jgi:hypothetical protein
MSYFGIKKGLSLLQRNKWGSEPSARVQHGHSVFGASATVAPLGNSLVFVSGRLPSSPGLVVWTGGDRRPDFRDNKVIVSDWFMVMMNNKFITKWQAKLPKLRFYARFALKNIKFSTTKLFADIYKMGFFRVVSTFFFFNCSPDPLTARQSRNISQALLNRKSTHWPE